MATIRITLPVKNRPQQIKYQLPDHITELTGALDWLACQLSMKVTPLMDEYLILVDQAAVTDAAQAHPLEPDAEITLAPIFVGG